MKKENRKSLFLKEKSDLIYEIERTGDQSAIFRRGKASKSTVSRIWTSKDKILETAAWPPLKTKKIRTALNEDLYHALIDWFNVARSKNISINSTILCKVAAKLVEKTKRLEFKTVDENEILKDEEVDAKKRIFHEGGLTDLKKGILCLSELSSVNKNR